MTKLLAYFPSPPQGVWHLGPLPVRAYALFIIAGIVAALLIGDRRWVARGGERGVIYDIALWTVPFGLVGGRLYHLATDWRTYWGPGGAGFGAAVRIWDGGLGIWGAVALGAVGAWIGCRRHGIPLPAFTDAVAPGVILAQAIGRLGNYFNQELYGRETTAPWGLEIFYRRDPSGYIDPHSLDGVSTGQVALVVQPTFLYELLWNLLIFVVLLYLDRRFTLGHGRLFALYVAGYCVGRFGVELLRDDTATHIAGIRINSFTSTFVFIGAVVYLMVAPKGREDPESLRGNAYEDEESAESEPELEPAMVGAATMGAAATAAAAGDAGESDAPVQAVAQAEPSEPETEEPEAEPEPEALAEEPEAEAVAEEPAADEAAADEPETEVEAQEPEAEAVAEEPAAESELEAQQPEADPEAEEPQAETEEPEAESEPESEEPEADSEPAAEEPETRAVAQESAAEEPEADSAPETEEPEADSTPETEEPAAEEPEAEEPETEEPAAEEPEAEEHADEPVVTEDGEPDTNATAEAESEEPAAPQPAEKTSDQPETRRGWGSRFRNRRSAR